MGIYYDDPYNLKNSDETRASIGFLAPYRSDDMLRFFAKKDYKVK